MLFKLRPGASWMTSVSVRLTGAVNEHNQRGKLDDEASRWPRNAGASTAGSSTIWPEGACSTKPEAPQTAGATESKAENETQT